eukprot:scaffold214_cov249-Pinguiococcus_pyrenoidosus.AAC.19
MREVRLLLALACAALARGAPATYSELEQLPLDSEGHLLQHLVLFNANCDAEAAAADAELRPSALASGSLASALGLDVEQASACAQMVCLEMGTRVDLVPHWNKAVSVGSPRSIGAALQRQCDTLEVGFVSNFEGQKLQLFWLNPGTGEERRNGVLDYGEKKIMWITSFLGHRFVVRNDAGELIDTLHIVRQGVYVVGENDTRVGSTTFPDSHFERVFQNEWRRHDKVQKKYSPLGFGRGHLPPDVWGSIGAYYHNNRRSFVREQWDISGGVFVNWWEADVDILIPPWRLKRQWQQMLMPMVQEWFNSEPLEPTDIYGLRRYNNGSRLIMHVDREATHALSMIVNIDQQNMREDWNVEINNHFDETHFIAMKPGEVVFYESAACLHGRMRPLMGDHYVNLFVHYRPVGDAQWYSRDGGLSPDLMTSGSPEKRYEMHNVDDLYNLWKNLNAPASAGQPVTGPANEL